MRVAPSQTPPHAEPSVVHLGRAPTGAPALAEHVPSEPGRLHCSHCPAHGPSQQTPSTHGPDAHSLLDAHDAPLTFADAQTPVAFVQKSPTAQSASIAHFVLHAVAPQVSAPHDPGTAGEHAPAPSHLVARVSTPPLHDAELPQARDVGA